MPTRYAYDALFLTRVQHPGGSLHQATRNALGWVTRRFGEVTRIAPNRWQNLRPVTLESRGKRTFGRRITFMPPSRLMWAPWRDDPLLDELGGSSRAERTAPPARRH